MDRVIVRDKEYFEYKIPLASFEEKGLTKKTIDWFSTKNVISLNHVIIGGEEKFKRLPNFARLRIEEVRKLIKEHAPLDYDFYARPVSLTHEETDAIQSKEYEKIRLSHLNLSLEILEKRNIYTLKNLLDTGIQGIDKFNIRSDTKIKLKERLKEFAEKLPLNAYNIFMGS